MGGGGAIDDALEALRQAWTSDVELLALHERRYSRGTTAQLLIRSARLQFSGQVERAVAALESARKRATVAERFVVDELLGPLYVSLGRLADLGELLEPASDSGRHYESRLALKAVLLACEGNYNESRAHRTMLRREMPLNDLLAALSYQRCGMAAFYTNDFAESTEWALSASNLAADLGAHRLSAVTYSILYAINHAELDNIPAAEEYSRYQEMAAKACGDRSIENSALVAQYEIAAEAADMASYEDIRRRLRARRLPQQFREHFQHAFSDAISFAWSGDFTAFKANIVVLQGVQTLTRAEVALCYALRALAEAANHETVDARRHARRALGLSSHITDSRKNALEMRVYRQSRAVAAATCILLGDSIRGRRVFDTKLMADPAVNAIFSSAQGGPSMSIGLESRGLSLAVAKAREVILTTTVSSPLTPAETAILRLLEAGMSAPEIARATKRSVHTVRVHIRNMISKLGVRGRSKAILRAKELGYL